MHTSARSAFLHCSRTTSLTSRTAVYGPVRTVVWQGSAGDCRPYADQSRRRVLVTKLFADLEPTERVGRFYIQVDWVCKHEPTFQYLSGVLSSSAVTAEASGSLA